MAFVPNSTVAMAVMIYETSSTQWTNTLYFENPGGFDASLLETLTDNLLNWSSNYIMPELPSDTALIGCTAYSLASLEAPLFANTLPAPVPGTDGISSAALNVALAVSFRTAVRGRTGRGRNYIAGMSETRVGPNTFTVSWADAVVLAYDRLRSPGDAGFNWGVYSRFLNKAPRANGAFFDITSVQVSDYKVDTQRRRVG